MNKTSLALGVLAVFTVLVIYFINLNVIQLPKQQAQNDYWEQEGKYSTENATLICPPSRDGEPISPDSCKRQDHYSYDRKQKIADHKAQLHMRNTAIGGFLVGVGGLILLWWTLNATRSAAKSAADTLVQAKEATNAAWASVEESKSQFIRQMQPGLIVTDVESLDFHMARKVDGDGEPRTELEVMAMELQEGGRYWHAGLWCKVTLRVRNWGKLPIHGINVTGTFSISSPEHDRPNTDEKPGTINGRHEFLAPETEDSIELHFCYASFYSDFVRTTHNDPLSGRTRLVLDDCFIHIMGEVYFRDQFTSDEEVRVLSFVWGDTYNPIFNRDKKKRKVSMRPIRTVKISNARS